MNRSFVCNLSTFYLKFGKIFNAIPTIPVIALFSANLVKNIFLIRKLLSCPSKKLTLDKT